MMGSEVNRAAQEDNKLQWEDRAAHDWYRFVLSFPPHLVREYIGRFGIGPPQRVLDPFCGTGTTLVECKKLGVPSVGIEANPMASFASRVKVQWNVDSDGLVRHACEIGEVASQRLEAEGINDADGLPLFPPLRKGVARLQTLPADASKLLLKGSISPLPLHKTLVLLQALQEHHHDQFTEHERLALAKAIVFGISNLEFGPEVGVGPARSDAPVVTIWLKQVRSMAEDLRGLRGKDAVPALAGCGKSALFRRTGLVHKALLSSEW